MQGWRIFYIATENNNYIFIINTINKLKQKSV